jgi:imidazolonepropionase-like amidohydrolase
VGTVAVGEQADRIVVKGDPGKNIAAALDAE